MLKPISFLRLKQSCKAEGMLNKVRFKTGVGRDDCMVVDGLYFDTDARVVLIERIDRETVAVSVELVDHFLFAPPAPIATNEQRKAKTAA